MKDYLSFVMMNHYVIMYYDVLWFDYTVVQSKHYMKLYLFYYIISIVHKGDNWHTHL